MIRGIDNLVKIMKDEIRNCPYIQTDGEYPRLTFGNTETP